MSELLGKGTIDKKSSGETKGRQGSSSRNYDVLGRELFTPDEVRKLDNKKCLIFIRGFDPIMDNKYIPFGHPAFAQTADGKGKPYVHIQTGQKTVAEQPYRILSPKAVAYYESLKEKGENVYIDTLTYEEFGVLTELDVIRQIKCCLIPQIKNDFLRYAEALRSELFAAISAHCFMYKNHHADYMMVPKSAEFAVIDCLHDGISCDDI